MPVIHKLFIINSDFLENYSINEILLFSIAVVTILFLVSNVLSIYRIKKNNKFLSKIKYRFSNHLYRTYLFKDYFYYAQNNSSEIISKITLEISRLIVNIVSPTIQLNSKIIMAFFILIGLNFVSGFITTTVALIIIIISYILFSFYKKQLKKNSKSISDNLHLRQKIIKESLQNIVETKFLKLKIFLLKTLINQIH